MATRPVALEADVTPPGSYRLPGPGRDGVLRRSRGGVLTRLIHHGEESAVVSAWVAAGRVRLRAEAPTRPAATHALGRMRFAIGVDHDLRPFQRCLLRDPLIGRVIRIRPWLRPRRRADPFEALAWAITEQLIETERAYAIQRRLVWRYGRRSACGALRDLPSAAALAARAPAELAACGLVGARAQTLVRASREVATGRAALDRPDRAAARLARIPGIGPWTLQCLAFHGHGDDDELPAGDLAYLKLVGRLLRLGRRATVDEVHSYFAPYEPYRGLAGLYLLAADIHGLTPPAPRWPGL